MCHTVRMGQFRPPEPLRVPAPRQRSLTRADLAGALESLIDRRVVLVNAEGAWYDFRAVTEIVTRPSGFGAEAQASACFPYVRVVAEAAWYAGERADGVWWPAGAVWVEDRV